MAKPSSNRPIIATGAVLDGFTIGECVHRGGMATLWSVSHPGINVPLLMKIPLISEGEDPAAIVSFEMEQMIVPRLAGPQPSQGRPLRGRLDRRQHAEQRQ